MNGNVNHQHHTISTMENVSDHTQNVINGTVLNGTSGEGFYNVNPSVGKDGNKTIVNGNGGIVNTMKNSNNNNTTNNNININSNNVQTLQGRKLLMNDDICSLSTPGSSNGSTQMTLISRHSNSNSANTLPSVTSLANPANLTV